MSFRNYVEKMRELGLGNDVLRVLLDDQFIYEGTMNDVLELPKPWLDSKVLGISCFHSNIDGQKRYNMIISI